jgi:hypothetical protein
MLVRDFALKLNNFSADKHIFVVMAHMDPFYYDTSDVEANSVSIVTDDEGGIWEICETDADGNIIGKQEVIES